MTAAIVEAYHLILGSEPNPGLAQWQIAEAVLNQFDVPRLGDKLAKRCIFEIVNHINYPNQEITTRLVSRAEGLATELWDDLPDEPHMAEIEWKEYQSSDDREP